MRKSTFILLAAAATLAFAFGCGKQAEETTTGKDVETLTPGDTCPNCDAADCDGTNCEGRGRGGESKGKGCGKGKGGGRTPEAEETDGGYRG